MDLGQHEAVAENLLIPLWRGFPEAHKMRYARMIWTQFEDAIRSAAYTSDLGKFLDALCTRSGIELRADAVACVRQFVAEADSRTVLKLLRDDTTLLVLLVRAENDRRKEAWKQRQREEEEGPDGNLLQ